MSRKWKWHRVLLLFLGFYMTYKFLLFMEVVYMNYTLGSPMDLFEMMRERNPKKFLQDFIKFKTEFVPFDFSQIAIENEQLIKSKREEFIRQSVHNYVSIGK